MKCMLLNAKGFNLTEKKSQVISTFAGHKGQIIFLQETHFRSDSTPKLTNHIYRTVLHSTNPNAKMKGVSILISKHANLHISDSLIDPKAD